MHTWPYPAEAFDVVVEIFSQFSTAAQRPRKWAGMRRALKRGGLSALIELTARKL